VVTLQNLELQAQLKLSQGQLDEAVARELQAATRPKRRSTSWS
jgi:hypothetical protein